MRILLSLIILTTASGYGQVNKGLSKQIDSLAEIDQKWRVLFRQVENKEIDTISINAVSKQMRIADSLNYLATKKIFEKSGYLGYDKVGKENSHNFWLLIQHADKYPTFQNEVLTQMKIEADNENASLLDYAYLVDRVKVNTGQLQIYGTQMTLDSAKTSYKPKPTYQIEKLNERRTQVGLPTIEEYIKTMNDHYYGTLRKN